MRPCPASRQGNQKQPGLLFFAVKTIYVFIRRASQTGEKPWFFPRRRHRRRGRREKRKKRIRTSGSTVVINFVKPLMDIFAHALKEG